MYDVLKQMLLLLSIVKLLTVLLSSALACTSAHAASRSFGKLWTDLLTLYPAD